MQSTEIDDYPESSSGGMLCTIGCGTVTRCRGLQCPLFPDDFLRHWERKTLDSTGARNSNECRSGRKSRKIVEGGGGVGAAWCDGSTVSRPGVPPGCSDAHGRRLCYRYPPRLG